MGDFDFHRRPPPRAEMASCAGHGPPITISDARGLRAGRELSVIRDDGQGVCCAADDHPDGAAMDGSRKPLRAVIYLVVGRPQTPQWRRQCHEHVEGHGYVLDTLAEETDIEGRPKLRDALRLLMSGLADVMVVATPDYLPSDWVPRIEVAGDSSDPFAIPPTNRPASDRPPRQRRPRSLRTPE